MGRPEHPSTWHWESACPGHRALTPSRSYHTRCLLNPASSVSVQHASMATTANAYDLLIGTGEKVQAGKKKKKSKPKAASNAAGGEAAQPAGQEAKISHAGLEVDVPEGCAILEDAARGAKSARDRCLLWKDWVAQVRVR